MEAELNDLFPVHRIATWKDLIVILLYFPIGLFLTTFRICLSLNYICAQLVFNCLFPHDHVCFTVMDHIFTCLLGIIVVQQGDKKLRANIIMCNKRSEMDGLVVSRVLKMCTEKKFNLPPFWCNVFRLRSLEETESMLQLTSGTKMLTSVLFPENCATSGSALLRFDRKYFVNISQLQLAVLKPYRVLPILVSTARSKWWKDLLWTYFSPMTIYNVDFSGDLLSKTDVESTEEFAIRVEKYMSKLMKVPTSTIQALDRKNYLKKLDFHDRHSKVQQRHNPSKISPELALMIKQVREVLPHVPEAVVHKDLQKTRSVDITMTNILEGIVKFEPVVNVQKSKPKTPDRRTVNTASMAERKAEFYNAARRRYFEKHGS